MRPVSQSNANPRDGRRAVDVGGEVIRCAAHELAQCGTFPPFAALAHFLLRRRRIWQEGGGMQSFAAREKKYVGSEIADIHQQFER